MGSNLINPSEFVKRCDKCHKNKPSRPYYRVIDGEWMNLCKDCWNKVETERKERKD